MRLLWQTVKFILKWLLIGYLLTIGGVLVVVIVAALAASGTLFDGITEGMGNLGKPKYYIDERTGRVYRRFW